MNENDRRALAAQFAREIKGWTVRQLVDSYASARAANSYGVNDEELSIVLAELESRCSA